MGGSRHEPLRRLKREAGPPLLLFVMVVALWHASVSLFGVKPFVVPGPLLVLRETAHSRVELLKAMGLTAAGAGCGFVVSLLAGTFIAFIFAQSRWIQRSAYPYAIFLQTVPIVAIAPLIIQWFGYGFPSVVVVAAIISLFPIITNGTTGLTTLDPNLVELFQLNNATRWQLLTRLRMPNSIPYFVTGAKISSGLSVIGAIVGEFFAGTGSQHRGLGYLISVTSTQYNTALLFASIIASALLGLGIFITVSGVGSLLTARWRNQADVA